MSGWNQLGLALLVGFLMIILLGAAAGFGSQKRKNQNNTSAPPMQTVPVVQLTGWKTWLMTWKGVAAVSVLLLVVGALIYFGWRSAEKPALWLAVVVIVALAAAGALGKGGAAGKYALGGLSVFLLLIVFPYLLFGDQAEVVTTTTQRRLAELVLSEPRLVVSPESNGKVIQPRWSGAQENTLPVGTWSDTIHVGVGCSASFDAGNGTDFRVRYSFYSSAWTLHPGGDVYPNANKIEFMLLKPRTEVPVRVKCS